MGVSNDPNLSRLMRSILASLLAVLAATCQAEQSSLEELLNKKQYEHFERSAKDALALPGAAGAEAAFLLAKSYHLGLGREVDLEQATAYYERAVHFGHARASHNLGMIALGRNDHDRAISLLNDALTRGLKMPTLINLGRAHDLTKSRMFGLSEERDSLLAAAGYYEAAYELQPNDALVNDIVRVRTTAFRIEPNEQDRLALMRWVDLGVQKDIPQVYQNYGAMLYYRGDKAAARPWFEKAHARGVPAAAYALGLLAERSEKSADKTLEYFMAAAKGGIVEAMHEADRIIDQRLNSAQSQQELSAALAMADELAPTADKLNYSFWPPYAYRSARERLEHIQAVEYNRAHPPALPPGQPLSINICLTDIPGPAGIPLAGEALRVVAVSDLRWDPLALPADPRRNYRTDARGCVKIPAGHVSWYRQQLNEGNTLYMIVNSRATRLKLVQQPRGSVLVPEKDESE